MAKPTGGLTKWFKKEKWVDISAPKRGVAVKPKAARGATLNVCHLQRLRP
jgi:hypothetical protein